MYLGDRLAVYNFLYYDGFYRSIDGEMLDVLDIGVGTDSYLNPLTVNAVALDVSSRMLTFTKVKNGYKPLLLICHFLMIPLIELYLHL